MKHLIEFPLEDGGTILVEVEVPEAPGMVPAARGAAEVVQKAGQTFEAALDKIRSADLPDGGYPFRHLVGHLLGAADWDALCRLLTNFPFLEGRAQATSVFDLEADYQRALAAWPARGRTPRHLADP